MLKNQNPKNDFWNERSTYLNIRSEAQRGEMWNSTSFLYIQEMLQDRKTTPWNYLYRPATSWSRFRFFNGSTHSKTGQKISFNFVDLLSRNSVLTVVKVNARSQDPSLINCFDMKNGTMIKKLENIGAETEINFQNDWKCNIAAYIWYLIPYSRPFAQLYCNAWIRFHIPNLL